MLILDGKTLSQKILFNLKKEISALKLKPVLDIIIVGDDPSSKKYVQMKQKAALSIGVVGEIHHLKENTSTDQLISLIKKLNKDSKVDAFMLQLPLPPQIDTQKALLEINFDKDADGLNPLNLGLLFQKKSSGIPPATAFGVITLLDSYNIEIEGKKVVIVGRSTEVALPLFALFLSKNATVTLCHSKSIDLKKHCLSADILVSAIGRPKYFNKDFIKKDTVVIDIGFSLDNQGKVSGDFDFNQVAKIASYITPVPGGVGPMTVVSLLSNTVRIVKKKHLL